HCGYIEHFVSAGSRRRSSNPGGPIFCGIDCRGLAPSTDAGSVKTRANGGRGPGLGAEVFMAACGGRVPKNLLRTDLMKIQRMLVVSEPGMYGVFLIVRQLIRFLHKNHPEVCVDWAYSSRRSWPDALALADEIRSHGGEAVDLRVSNSPEPADG